MRNSALSVGLAAGSLWGGAMLAVGLANMVKPEYGKEFLKVISSVYPGANRDRTLGRVALGGAYGLADGFIAGLLAASLYGAFHHEPEHERTAREAWEPTPGETATPGPIRAPIA